jgi:hypothetical protein
MDLTGICPNCNGPMAPNNFFCRLSCYKNWQIKKKNEEEKRKADLDNQNINIETDKILNNSPQ